MYSKINNSIKNNLLDYHSCENKIFLLFKTRNTVFAEVFIAGDKNLFFCAISQIQQNLLVGYVSTDMLYRYMQ